MVYHQQRRERPFCLEPRLSQGGWERRGEKRREEKKEGRIKGVGIGYYHNARQPYLYFFKQRKIKSNIEVLYAHVSP